MLVCKGALNHAISRMHVCQMTMIMAANFVRQTTGLDIQKCFRVLIHPCTETTN